MNPDEFRFGFQVGSFFHRPADKFIGPLLNESLHLLAARHQIAIKNLVNPYTSQKRLFVKHDTGSGKTVLSWKIIREFLKIPGIQIVVLGFENTKDVFIKEALRYPELGFITQAEYSTYTALHSAYIKTRSYVALQEFKEYGKRLRLKITGKRGTSIQFYGYQEFANRVGFRDDNARADNVEINTPFVNSLKYSVILADEITNTYNSVEMNSRGRAIKYVLDTHGDNIVFVCHSATPLNNSAAEAIELAQFLNKGELRRQDYFNDDQLRNVEAFSRLYEGRISVYHLAKNTSLFPTVLYPDNAKQFGNIDPNQFPIVQCQMSDDQIAALRESQESSGEEEVEGNQSTYFLRDFALRGPNGRLLLTAGDLQLTYGSTAPHENVVGAGLKKMSAKYAQFIEDIRMARGKTLIFHPRVQWGAKLIEQIMEAHDYIKYDATHTNATPCVVCGIRFDQHEQKVKGTSPEGHKFVPSKMATVHHEVDKNTFKVIRDLYNSPENRNGEQIQHLIGTNVMAVGYDFNCIRHIFVLGFPDTYPNMIQLFGRAIRTNSHQMLPFDQRNTTIHIYANVDGAESPERYLIKWPNYQSVIRVNRLLDNLAIDRDFYESRHDEPPTKDKQEYYAYELFEDDVSNIYYTIKKLFTIKTIWKDEDLMRVVRDPPFVVHSNMAKVSEAMIKYVLSKIIYYHSDKAYLHTIDTFHQSASTAATLFNIGTYSKYFMRGGQICVLVHRHPFFILMPVDLTSHKVSQMPIMQRPMVRYKINLETYDVNKLLAVKDPKVSLFKEFPIDAHEGTIRKLIQSGERMHPMTAFYVRLGIIKWGKDEIVYYRNTEGFRLVGTAWTQITVTRPPYAPLLGYFDKMIFKMIEINKSKHLIETGRVLKKNISGKNKDKTDARQFARGAACTTYPQGYLQELIKPFVKKETEMTTLNMCELIEDALIKQQVTRGGEMTSFLFWGPPI